MLNARFFSINGFLAILLSVYGLHIAVKSENKPQNAMPPVAVCNATFDLVLNNNGTKNLIASQLDDGSYDPAGNFLFFKMRRVSPGPCGSDDLFRSQLRFCCEDAGDTIEVVFRVYNISVDTGAVSPDFGVGNYDDCVARVIVDEVVNPQVSSLPNITLSCETYTNPATEITYPAVFDNCCLDTVTYVDQYLTYDATCKRGNIRRRFTARDCAGNTATSTQLVTVTNEQLYYAKFPDDKVVVGCSDLSPASLGAPVILENNCENMYIGHIDTVQYSSQSAPCMSIIRTWRVYNWCHYSGSAPLIYVPNPTPMVNPIAPANFTGPVVGPPGIATAHKILPFDPSETDYSAFWTPEANGFIYQQRIFVYDTVAPKGRVTAPSLYCDQTINDPNLWQGPTWFNPVNNSNDLFDGPTDITLKAIDNCSNTNLTASYVLFLDLDGDQIVETFVNSANPPPPGSILFNNVTTIGEQRQFDRRITSIDNKYVFALEKVPQGDSLLLRVRWNSMGEPNTYVMPQFPYGSHFIVWTVIDRCGNATTFNHYFSISDDCIAPTVTCYPGTSVNIPTDGSLVTPVALSDLLANAVDNRSLPENILTAVERQPYGDVFPLNNVGAPQDSIWFTCADLGYREVRVWARDEALNTSHCTAIVAVKDPNLQCPDYLPAISGTATNLLEQPVPLNFELYQMPDTNFIGSCTNTALGYYYFNDLAQFGNYFVRPQLDTSDLLNGINAFDLILISRHILNLEPFDSPYKLIAADANKSNTVTTFDIVTLRKVILGSLTVLPGNTSWRFIPRSFTFPNPNNPFSTAFPEQYNVSSAFNIIENADFYGIKIGDVDYTATPTPFGAAASDRTMPEEMKVIVGNHLDARARLPVYIEAQTALAGFQMALDIGVGARFIPVLTDNDHFALSEQGVLSIVVDDYPLITSKRVLLGWIEQSSGMALVHTPTLYNAAFLPNGEQRSIGLYAEGEQQILKASNLKVWPNPARTAATLVVEPESDADGQIDIRDVDGRLLFHANVRGKQTLELPMAHWPAGIYTVAFKDNKRLYTTKLIKI